MKFLAVFAALVAVTTGASSTEWTLGQLSAALESPSTDPALVPYLEAALNEMMDAIFAGVQLETVSLSFPNLDVSSWTLQELSDALDNPTTDAALVPYLENALDQLMTDLMAGHSAASIVVVVPVGISEPEAVAAAPVKPTPAPQPAVPAPVATPSTSPLVQIVVNVNSQQQAAPEVVATPVEVIQPIVPSPVVVVDQPIIPSPDIVVEQPQPVQINPIDVIAVSPAEANPIDMMPMPGVIVAPIEPRLR